MEIKFNNKVFFWASGVLIAIYLFGFPIFYLLLESIFGESQSGISMDALIISNIGLIAKHSSGLIMGLWIYLNADKLKLYKWTSAFIGLISGYFILVLAVLALYFQNDALKQNKYKLILKLLALTVTAYIISAIAKLLLNPYLALNTDVPTFGFIIEYSAYLTLASYAMMVLLSLVIFYKLDILKKKKLNAA